jgi:hypothetical protein
MLGRLRLGTHFLNWLWKDARVERETGKEMKDKEPSSCPEPVDLRGNKYTKEARAPFIILVEQLGVRPQLLLI